MESIRLNIGSQTRIAGWKTVDIVAGPEVDFVGDCSDLSRFSENSVAAIYASHVLEHLSYQEKLMTALKEWRRVLVPGGDVMISVPDLDTLCRLFLHPDYKAEHRFHIMRIMFGGQLDPHDFHQVGLNWEFLGSYLLTAGFVDVQRVLQFGIVDDASNLTLAGVPISLNVKARKPA